MYHSSIHLLQVLSAHELTSLYLCIFGPGDPLITRSMSALMLSRHSNGRNHACCSNSSD